MSGLTLEQVEQMAKDCGDDWDSTLPTDREFLVKFAALAYAAGQAAERERIASAAPGLNAAMNQLEQSIRARGES